ncbi:hypothetical protein NDU88_004965 [Pleurodeles waltl]|uniref:Uncharacterized protein n=1 Tax=Pleurodeles waltl TaxID=8319 RepID=A0AAV7VLU6_PLEWA|nr:hypothetical protein NDU88_004965 [Pleurodeles waltl]
MSKPRLLLPGTGAALAQEGAALRCHLSRGALLYSGWPVPMPSVESAEAGDDLQAALCQLQMRCPSAPWLSSLSTQGGTVGISSAPECSTVAPLHCPTSLPARDPLTRLQRGSSG